MFACVAPTAAPDVVNGTACCDFHDRAFRAAGLRAVWSSQPADGLNRSKLPSELHTLDRYEDYDWCDQQCRCLAPLPPGARRGRAPLPAVVGTRRAERRRSLLEVRRSEAALSRTAERSGRYRL